MRPWLKHKKDKCDSCGFVPQHPCQLDVDHIDANKNNNDPGNLRTLCANCHRLKTQLGRDWDKAHPASVYWRRDIECKTSVSSHTTP